MKKVLPLRSLAEGLGLYNCEGKKNCGKKPYFDPEGKVALMFLKMYTQLSFPMLMDQLNANIHYQIFCGIRIAPEDPLTNCKFLNSIARDISGRMDIGKLQKILAESWKPMMKDLDTMYTDATCYESEMRYPTDAKLLWECVEKTYGMMCSISRSLGLRRPRTKFLDVEKANLAYSKQRRHSKSQTRKLTGRLIKLLGKILA